MTKKLKYFSAESVFIAPFQYVSLYVHMTKKNYQHDTIAQATVFLRLRRDRDSFMTPFTGDKKNIILRPNKRVTGLKLFCL